MGAISIEKTNELFWLGRYVERTYTSLTLFCQYYDRMIDTDEVTVSEVCHRLNIPMIYADDKQFLENYLFDKSDPNSIISNLARAYDNAVMLRREISSETLAYIQLAVDVMDEISHSSAPLLEVQQVMDYLLAFWGSCEDFADSARVTDIMRCGKCVERVDLYLRLNNEAKLIKREFAKLISLIYSAEMDFEPKKLRDIDDYIEETNDFSVYRADILNTLNTMFRGV